MDKELNEDARTKQDLLYECSKDGELLLEYIEQLEQQCRKQKEVIDKLNDLLSDEFLEVIGRDKLLDILKEVSE